jgi:hypothetical protein
MTARIAGRLAVPLGSFWDGFTRAAILIIGGVTTLQGSNVLDPPKLAYLIVAGVCVLSSILAVVRRRASADARAMRALLVASIGLVAVVAASFPIALAAGTPVTNWFRDAANYGLFAAVPFVALDAYWSGRQRPLVALLLVVGVFATTSYALAWMDSRHIIDAPVDRLVLPSGQLTTALFALLIALSIAGRRSVALWTVAVGVDMAVLLLVGGRARIPMLALPLAVAVIAWRLGPGRLALCVAGQAAVAAAAFALLYGTVSVVPSLGGLPTVTAGPSASPEVSRPPSPIDKRFESIPGLMTNLASDASFQERVAQTIAAWQVFVASPVLGSGPGREISWVNSQDQIVRSYNLDTPVMVAAKFGVVGAAVIAAWMLALFRLAWRLVSPARTAWQALALAGFALLIPYAWLFVVPIEDKGLAFSLMILLPLAQAARAGLFRRTSAIALP